jgi:glycosyltransferase involved in cell wall biosynthesis
MLSRQRRQAAIGLKSGIATMPLPSISVIMPNFNHAAYLPISLGAILSQSHHPLEVIVVDDASTDDSMKVLERHAARAPLRIIRNERNLGAIPSANIGIDAASGEYLCFQSADDMVLPGFFEGCGRFAGEHPEAAQCMADPGYFHGDDPTVHGTSLGLASKPSYFDARTVARLQRSRYFNLPSHSSIFRRGAVLAAGKFDPALKWHADWFLYNVLAFRHGVCYLPKVLSAFRLRPDSFSTAGRRDRKQMLEIVSAMMDRLAEPVYRDVAPLFTDSRVFREFGWIAVAASRSNASRGKILPARDRPYFLLQELRRLLGPRLPKGLKAWVRSVQDYTARPHLA